MNIYGLLAETFVHPGSGSSSGAIDLPVAREVATGYPFVPGAGVKGALRDLARQSGWEGTLIDRLFGLHDDAGQLLVADARLLLLPVRSLSRAYAWLTCPHLLERLERDLRRAGRTAIFTVPTVDRDTALAAGGSPLVLEERQFTVLGQPAQDLISAITPLILHQTTSNRLEQQLAILSDEDFAYFAAYGLSVAARNQLDSATKVSQNLWYEETLPPDTLMYLLLGERASGTLETVPTFDYLQLGGNETVGQGWFAVRPWVQKKEAGE